MRKITKTIAAAAVVWALAAAHGPAGLVAAQGGAAASAQRSALCVPKVEGPIASTADSSPYRRVDLPANVVEQEFFVSCRVAAGEYKTLVHVRAPKDPARASGIVVVEPWHPGNLWPLYAKVSEYEARAGHTAVIVVGNPLLLADTIKKANPTRYAALSLPGAGARSVADTGAGETTEFEVLSQVGALIKSGRLTGVRARKVILGGMSQTGGVVRAYIAHEHPKGNMKSVYDGYFPEQSAATSYKGAIDDLDVPVVEIQGERELIVVLERGADHVLFRRPDGPLYRLYEVTGLPHVSTRGRPEGGGANCSGHTRSDFPTFFVYAAALDNMIGWVDKGIAAPHADRIDTSTDGREIHRDRFGNALGGVRTSYVDVATKTYHSTWALYHTTPTGPSDPDAARCDKNGWIEPLPRETLRQLYPTHEDYVAKVNKSLDALVKGRWILVDDARELRAEATTAAVP